MIRAAVTGGSTTLAGEVIKILINHPDVEISWIHDTQWEGAPVSEIHKGLRGDTYMRFTSQAPMEDVDVIFLCDDHNGQNRTFIDANPPRPDARIIDLSGEFLPLATFADGDRWIFGLPELCRKPLVRGAIYSAVPGALTSVVLLSLLPLAKEKALVDGDIHITAVVAEEEADPGEAIALIDLEEADDITRAIKSLQPEFARSLTFMVINGGWHRGISVSTHFKCSLSEAALRKIYEEYYSDHGFTFISDSLPTLNEVAGTNKTIINVQKVGERAVISATADNLTKGGGGNAVHNMNLLFGLSERVGLSLKAQS